MTNIHSDCDKMKRVRITLEDGFGKATTRVYTKLSPPQLMDKILEVIEDD